VLHSIGRRHAMFATQQSITIRQTPCHRYLMPALPRSVCRVILFAKHSLYERGRLQRSQRHEHAPCCVYVPRPCRCPSTTAFDACRLSRRSPRVAISGIPSSFLQWNIFLLPPLPSGTIRFFSSLVLRHVTARRRHAVIVSINNTAMLSVPQMTRA